MFKFCMDCAYLSVNRVNDIGENSNFSSQLRAELHCASPILYHVLRASPTAMLFKVVLLYYIPSHFIFDGFAVEVIHLTGMLRLGHVEAFPHRIPLTELPGRAGRKPSSCVCFGHQSSPRVFWLPVFPILIFVSWKPADNAGKVTDHFDP